MDQEQRFKKRKSEVSSSCIRLQPTPQRNATWKNIKSVPIQCANGKYSKIGTTKERKIFVFVDDVTVVITGNNQLIDAQEALNIIERECCCLGLKINPSKTKAMSVKDVDLGGHLTLEQQRIEWVRHHQCLGIWIDSKLSFHKQVEHLRERTSARLAPMKHITSLLRGANYHVLRTFYVMQ